MNKDAKLAELRHSLATYALPDSRPPLGLGHAAADAVLGGGLRPGALHEVFAGDWGAGGFAACLAILAARGGGGGAGPLFWVRPDYEALEYGALSAGGLLELGGDPAGLILLRVPQAAGALAAASDILSCPHVGVLLLEIGGNPRSLDLVASRRLAFAAAEGGATVILLREGAAEEPSAALTRWQVTTAPSDPADDDWGSPRFAARLVRHRLGGTGSFRMQWDCEDGIFGEAAADIGAVAAATAHRPADAQNRIAV